MIPEYSHKINERLTLVKEAPTTGESRELTIRRISDGSWFNFMTGVFEAYNSANLASYIDVFSPMDDNPGLIKYTLLTLPTVSQDLIFAYTSVYTSLPYTADGAGDYSIEFGITESGGTSPSDVAITVNGSVVYTETGVQASTGSVVVQQTLTLSPGDVVDTSQVAGDGTVTISNVSIRYSDAEVSYERHLFGGRHSINEPTTCRVYGTLKDVSGSPLEGQKVEAYLNRAGFFTHKAGLIGYAATALTDETGYFELPLIVGLDVTINVPIIGFTQRGFVPNLTSVELTSQTLLSYQP